MSDWQSEWTIEADDDEHGNVLKNSNSQSTGAALIVSQFMGNEDWSNYTLELDMRIDGGAEGWLIYSAVESDSDYIMYNIGGWGNTKTCFEPTIGGAKTSQSGKQDVSRAFTVGQWYHLTMEVHEMYVITYIDGEQFNTYVAELG